MPNTPIAEHPDYRLVTPPGQAPRHLVHVGEIVDPRAVLCGMSESQMRNTVPGPTMPDVAACPGCDREFKQRTGASLDVARLLAL